MSVLSDVRILESIYDREIQVEPFVNENIQPSSIDLTLDNKIKVPKKGVRSNIFEELDNNFDVEELKEYTLNPGETVLGQIKETITLSSHFTAVIHNRSSLVRSGIDVALSTYINPGYSGQLPIIIRNIGRFEIELVPGMRICQLVIHDVEPDPSRDYSEMDNAKYYGEEGIRSSKLYLDKEFKEYISSYNIKNNETINVEELMSFFDERLEEKTINITNNLSKKEKERLGL